MGTIKQLAKAPGRTLTLFTPLLPNKLTDFSTKLKTVADTISPGQIFKLKIQRQLRISKGRLRQDLLKYIKLDAKPGWSPLTGSSSRYLYWYYNPDDFFSYYLINRADIPRDDMIHMNTAVYTARKLGAELLDHGGLKRFEGRSWRGFHHHITLCFMAHYFPYGQVR